MNTNKTKAKLKAGESVIGCYLRYADFGLAEVLGHLGWDYLLFDGEHTPLSLRECETLARVCELRDVTSIVRVPSNLPWMIGQALDTGMEGIQVPMIGTAEEASLAARAAKYHPLGTRGLAGARAANYGQKAPFDVKDHIATSNNESLMIAQIETAAAVEQLPGILAVPDIDVIFIGPNDLSLSLGLPGELQHPTVQQAFDTITSAVLATNKALGVMATSLENALHWQQKGARYIMIVLEAIMSPAIRGFLQTVRAR